MNAVVRNATLAFQVLQDSPTSPPPMLPPVHPAFKADVTSIALGGALLACVCLSSCAMIVSTKL